MKAIRKSFKREIAVAGLAFWTFITGYMFWYADFDRLPALHAPYSAVTWAVWAYAAAAFGMHTYAARWDKT